MDDRHRVLGGVVRRDPLDGGDDDVARLVVGRLAGGSFDRPGELDGVVLGLLADGVEEDRLGVLAGHPAHPLERPDLLLVGLGDFLAGPVDLALPVEDLAVATLEHVGPLVELLVALEEASLEVGQLGPLGAGLVLRLALEADLLLLRLEDEVLLLAPRLLDDQGGLLLGLLDPAAGEDATCQESENGSAGEGQQGHRRYDKRIHRVFLPSDRPVEGVLDYGGTRWGGNEICVALRAGIPWTSAARARDAAAICA